MNPLLRNSLMGLGLFGAGGAGGYYLGQKEGDEEVEEQQNVFDEYNKEENESLANEAFLEGVNYGLGKTSNLKGVRMEKETFDKIAAEAFQDELNKIAVDMSGVKSGAKTVLDKILGAGKKVGQFYAKSARDAAKIPSTIKGVASKSWMNKKDYSFGKKIEALARSSEMRQGLKGAGVIGGTAAVGGLGLYKALKSNKSEE